MAEQQFNTWVRPLHAIELPGALKLLAPNRFVVDWVSTNLLPRISVLLMDSEAANAPLITVEVGSREPAAALVAQPVAAATRERRAGLVVGSNLQAHFTFASFVEGKGNHLAKAAALKVAENPGRAYNPLFLYGGVGLGKTHLMQAIGHLIKERDAEAR